MPDRRNAPIFAAAAAFVLVLAFGKLFGSTSASTNPNSSLSPTPTPAATASSSPTASPKPGSTGKVGSTITTAPPALVELTVEATEQLGATSGVQVPEIQVRVLPDRKHARPVKTGTLFPEVTNPTTFEWSVSLPPATYQVCVQPPTATQFTGTNSGALPGWFCMTVPLAQGSPPVMFTLARAS